MNDLELLHADFHLQELAPKANLFANPFDVEFENVNPKFQMELIELQCQNLQKARHAEVSLLEFYRGLDVEKFPNLVNHGLKMSCLFGTTYICEQTFSLMKLNKSRLRARLTDKHLHDILRIATTKLRPDIKQLVTKKTCHFSH